MLTPTSRPTRQRLVDAAEKLMRTTGLASATTKAIAREAGCSEAALYKHFTSKEELFVRVIHERLPNIGPLIGELIADPGERAVEECLAVLVRQAARFYEEAFPMFGTLLAEPALRAQYRDGLRKIDAGPHLAVEGVARYLERERDRGRVRAEADLYAAAALLMGACFQRAFFIQVSGADRVPPAEEFAAAVARTAWAAVRP
ncbi:TetR/AcrR family transcriptional regulator [Streptomyces sp. NBC_01537]|uniref:TetR/AcrR family transcriptional regulator n=1 Tax=Streptomyces sp. NBC_01537 TaxID=2903896 RepID=UPI0038667181